MDNLEYLEKVKPLSSLKEYILGTECKALEEQTEIRKVIALEIIAETLINIDNKLDSLINDGKVINVDTHEV